MFVYHLSSLTSKMETGKTIILVDLKEIVNISWTLIVVFAYDTNKKN